MAKRHPKTFLCFLTLALCLVAQSSYATIPTLETDSGALELRIADGIEANTVAFDDVWHWPDGVSAGDGDVPKDGGGTVKVSTFLTEIIAGAVYIIHKNLAFGDGSSSSWFSSLNQMIYYEDGNTFEVLSAATLQLGELSGSGDEEWGIDGSCWSMVAVTDINITNGSSVFLLYDSVMEIRSDTILNLGSADFVDVRNSVFKGQGGSVHFWPGIGTLNMLRVNFLKMNFALRTTPDVLSDIFVNSSAVGIYAASASVTFFDASVYNSAIQMNLFDNLSHHALYSINQNTLTTNVRIIVGDGLGIFEQYTTNVHISDSSGSDLEGATVTMESYGNVVKNASTFYRCLIDHTASATFQDDLDANRWIVTTSENADKAGVTGADAINGLWVTGADYEDAEELFSEVTNSEGNIPQQVINYAKWTGTSEVRHSYPPYSGTITAPGFATLKPDLVAPTIIDGTVQPFVEHWQLESGATKRPRAQRHGQ